MYVMVESGNKWVRLYLKYDVSLPDNCMWVASVRDRWDADFWPVTNKPRDGYGATIETALKDWIAKNTL